MKKIIYDLGGNGDGVIDGCARGSPNCPKFIFDTRTQLVTLIDRKGNKSSMSVAEWNRLHKLIRTDIIKEL